MREAPSPGARPPAGEERPPASAARAPPRSPDYLALRAARTPALPALETEDRTWSYRDLDLAVSRMARRIAARLGPQPEREPPVVAAALPRTATGVALLHAVWRAGGVLAPLHPGWTSAERSARLARLRPDLVLEPDEVAAESGEGPGRGRGKDASEPGEEVPVEDRRGASRGTCDSQGIEEADAEPEEPEEGASGDPHSILCTSGSTGRPKLVVLSLGAHLRVAHAAARRLELRTGDRWLASLEFAHVGGLALALRAAVTGATLVLVDRFDAELWNRWMEARRITHASLVPTMLARMLDAAGEARPPPSLRCLLVGGAAMPGDLLDRALGLGYPVALTYGLTEASSQVATAPPELVRRKPGTVGPPLEPVELRVSPDGEMLLRGPTLALGYRDRPGGLPLQEGWFRTGDLGKLDADGHVWVVGRRTAQIVTGGVNVDPAEVERTLSEHPAVREAVVFGLPDREWGERVVAAVEPAEAHRAKDPTRLRELLDTHCRERLSGPRRPKQWIVATQLPRTAGGKVDRAALRLAASEGRETL